MENIGFWSIIPPILAIVLAIKTRQVFIALLSGLFIGKIILSGGNPVAAFFSSVQALIDVFKEPGNTRTVIFSCLVGSLIILIQASGGVDGFVKKIGKALAGKKSESQKKKVQIFALLTGLLVFIESNISVLTVGTIFRPLFDKLKISREKLAYVADSVSSPVCILIPLNAWGAYVMGILITYNIEAPFTVLAKSVLFNFYPIFTLIIILFLVLTGKDFGPMKTAQKNTLSNKDKLKESKPGIASEISSVEVKKGIEPKAFNMLLPISSMVLLMPLFLVNSGWDKVVGLSIPLSEKIFKAVGEASGSEAVLLSVCSALLISGAYYAVKKIFNIREFVDLSLKGMSSLLPLALLMVLAFAIGALCREMGTGVYIAEITKAWLDPAFIPLILFLTSCFISFSTGTSWGTYAIMLAIALPMVESTSANLYLCVSAVLGGGVFGDHCSPISDTTIISSMAASCDHIDHVKTQIPYAVTAGTISSLFYLLFGMLL